MIDITFNIPLRIDSKDRLDNINAIIKYLKNNFNAYIAIVEIGKNQNFFPEKDIRYTFIESDDIINHQTKLSNFLIKQAETPYIISHDADVIIPKRQMELAFSKLREGFDLVYPFSGNFYGIPKHAQSFFLTQYNPTIANLIVNDSVGGCQCWNKKTFINIGMGNENFKGWGWEDKEQYERAKILELSIYKVEGNLYHLEHCRSILSMPGNQNYYDNKIEYDKVKNMTKQQLQEYIKTWKWCS